MTAPEPLTNVCFYGIMQLALDGLDWVVVE
jgi:hypothetical protein